MKHTTVVFFAFIVTLTGSSFAQMGVGTVSPSNALDLEGSDGSKTHFDINNTGGGDPAINLQVGGTSKFTIGVDNSDSDNLKIGTDATFASTPAITVDATSQNVGVGTASPASALDLQGSLGLKVTTITGTTTLDNSHSIVLCNSGTDTVNLPAAASNAGRVYTIKSIDAEGDDITVDGNGSETIDGATTFILASYKQTIRIISDGSNWHTLTSFGL